MLQNLRINVVAESPVFKNTKSIASATSERSASCLKTNLLANGKSSFVGMLLLLLFVLGSLNSNAQLSNYSFSASSGTYSAISGTTVLGAGLDDDFSSLTNIGFNFVYDGTTYTQFSACSNGFITLGATADPYAYGPISGSTNSIAFMGRDARTGGAVTYALTGSTPNRVLTIQYPTYNITYSSSTNYIDVQVQLYEGTNVIKFIYGASARATSYSPQVGLVGSASTNFKNRTTTTSWSASSAGTANSDVMAWSTTVYPASGQIYTWTPSSACSGTPTAGTVSASPTTFNYCTNFVSTLTLTGNTGGTGITYLWEKSPDNATWTTATGTATGASYSASGYTANTYFRCKVTCTNSSVTSNTSSILVTYSTPNYASLPYVQNFENAWSSFCATADKPDANAFIIPTTGNDAWRQDNNGSTASWSGATGGMYSVAGANGTSRSARFHAYWSYGVNSVLYVPINMSVTGNKELSFYYTNADGTDNLSVYLSTDGGATFTFLNNYGVNVAWSKKTIALTSTSSTAIIAFVAVGDFGNSDIGLDEINCTLACSGTPAAGTVTGTTTVTSCTNYVATLGLTGSTIASGISYAWEQSTNNITFTPATGANTGSSYISPSLTSNMYYRAKVTCANSAITSTSAATLVTYAGPTYQTLPVTQNFDATWVNFCNTRDVPAAYFINSPSTGNQSWRREDDGTSAAWSSTFAGYTPAGANSSAHSARFHTYDASFGTSGRLNYYLNFNVVGTKSLSFWYINTTGSDNLKVFVSTDGGLSFIQYGATLGIAASWTKQAFNLGISTSSTAIVRFEATSDYGFSDIGIDEVDIKNCTGIPTAIIGGPNAACLNANVYYSLSNVSGPTLSGYNWTVVGGTIVSGQNTAGITVNWTSTGAKTIACDLLTSTGCNGLTPTLNVNVSALPTATFTGTTSVCVGTPYTYTATTTGSNYTWTPTGGSITAQTANTVTIVWSNVSTASLTLNERFSTGCAFSTTQSITVSQLVTLTTSGPLQVCVNQSATYSLTGATVTNVSVTNGTITGATATTATILWTTAGTATVTVTYGSGSCTYNTSYSVNVNPLPTPAVTGTNTVCTGTTINYTTAFNPGRNYAWTVSGGGTIVAGQGSNTISVQWNTAGANSVFVNETIVATGCAANSSAYSVSVTTAPTSTITGATNVCSGGTFSYSAPAATTYAWTVTGGTISGSATASTVSVVWGAGPAGSVSVVTANGICNSTSNVATIINTTPAPVITGPSAICSGSANVYSTGFNSSYTYTWTITNGTYTFAGNNNTINVTPNTGATNVTVAVLASLNGTTCNGSGSKAVTVSVTPTVTITGNTSVCQNSTQVYTGVGASTYTFSVTGGVITSSTATTATIVWGPNSGNGTVRATGTSAAGCSSSGSLAVTVNPLPSSDIAGSAQVCANNGSSYSVTSQSGATYAWTVTGGTINGSATGSSINVNWGAPGAGTVNVTVTSGAGCVSTRTLNTTVNVQPAPVLIGAATVCENATQTYTITSIAGSSYNWSVNGGNIVSGSGTNSVTVLWKNVGTGLIAVSQSTGICIGSGSTIVTVNASPAIPTVYKVGNVLSTTATATSYQWFNNGASVSGATTNTYNATIAGNYTLVVTNAAGCSTSSTTVIANVGIKAAQSLTHVQVYPNPTSGMITIAATLAKSQYVAINIYDINGKLVYTSTVANADINFSKNVNIESFASGVYMVQLVTDNGSVQQRIVKE